MICSLLLLSSVLKTFSLYTDNVAHITVKPIDSTVAKQDTFKARDAFESVILKKAAAKFRKKNAKIRAACPYPSIPRNLETVLETVHEVPLTAPNTKVEVLTKARRLLAMKQAKYGIKHDASVDKHL